MAIGDLASPCDSIPLAKFSNLSLVERLGPNQLEIKIMNATKPPANNNCNAMGK
jgi:hypothetical protein